MCVVGGGGARAGRRDEVNELQNANGHTFSSRGMAKEERGTTTYSFGFWRWKGGGGGGKMGLRDEEFYQVAADSALVGIETGLRKRRRTSTGTGPRRGGLG